MVEALEWAADYAQRTKLFDVPINSRGYTIDGMKAPDSTERVKIITELAKTVADKPDEAMRRLIQAWHDELKDATLTDEWSSVMPVIAHMERWLTPSA